MPLCARCGQDNPEIARFCLACGAPIAAAETERTARKTVTVVFSDVSGSTALGEQLDPEAFQQVQARYFDCVRSALERHGGTVEKFIGDAAMAVFGIPQVHEDDALRAVRAAVEAQRAIAELSEELGARHGVALEVRTGVNTGEVVARDPSSGSSFATGDAVNVAARLEQAAAPGDILIGQATYRLVRDAVRVEPAGPLALKGKTDDVPAFRLLAVDPAAPGVARRLDSPIVGRQRELRRLADAFEQAVGDRSCQLFTLLGAAGVGKSRLVEEFVQALDGRARVLRGRCLSYGEGITYWPVAEAVRDAGGITDDDTAEAAREKLAALLGVEEESRIVHARVAEVIGIDEAGSMEDAPWAVRKLLEALTADQPLVVVFDDIHWGDPAFLDLVEHVADLSREAPILLVCLARPELLDVRSDWAGGKVNATSILLQPLGEDACEQLIESLLGQVALEPVARRRLIDSAEGNPLFVEEMLGMLIDDGMLARRNGSWDLLGEVEQLSIPPTIQALLAARLDRLGGDERAVIERAAVEGKVFHRGAVAELAPEGLRPAVETHLLTLVRKELVRPERPTFSREEAFRFRHLLIRDAAYAALAKDARAELHERFAAWLERKAGDRMVEYEEILGYHLEQAHRYRAELGRVGDATADLALRAGRHLAAAGQRAVARGDHGAAQALLRRAIAILPEQEPERLECLIRLAEVLSDWGEIPRATDVVGEALDAAARRAEPRFEWRARLVQALVRKSVDRDMPSDAVAAVAERAIPVLAEAGDEDGLALAWSAVSDVHWAACRWSERAKGMERALVHARRAGNRAYEARLLGWIAVSHYFGATPVDDAIARIEEMLAGNPGQRSLEAAASTQLGGLFAMKGRFDRARELARRGTAISEELGLTVRLGGRSMVAAEIEVLAGDLEAAERRVREGFGILNDIGETAILSTVAGALAAVLCDLGRFDEAEEFSRVSETTAAEDDIASQMLWRAVRARVLAHRGRSDEAESLARAAVAIGEPTDFLNMRGGVHLALAEVLYLADRLDGARDALRSAVALYEEKGNVVMVERALSYLAAGPSG